MVKLNPTDIFYAFNTDMDAQERGQQGKHKYHFFIVGNKYFIINTKKLKLPWQSSFFLRKTDCKILTNDCYINTTFTESRPDMSSFEIKTRSELLKEPLKKLIEHIKYHRSLTRTQIKEIIEPLEKAL